MTPHNHTIEIKICGLTDPAEAVACAAAGVQAIGLVFHPSSPRYVTPPRARVIAASLPREVARVGVFVDDDARTIRAVAETVGLTSVQLHGATAYAAGNALCAAGLHVIFVLREAATLVADVRHLPPDARVLIECGRGRLPGGNGVVWAWEQAAVLANLCAFAIAGGITPDNVGAALTQAHACAVDLSSSVETTPGRKDLPRIIRLVAAVRNLRPDWPTSPVFLRKAVSA